MVELISAKLPDFNRVRHRSGDGVWIMKICWQTYFLYSIVWRKLTNFRRMLESCAGPERWMVRVSGSRWCRRLSCKWGPGVQGRGWGRDEPDSTPGPGPSEATGRIDFRIDRISDQLFG
jgi:hypothetical protein